MNRASASPNHGRFPAWRLVRKGISVLGSVGAGLIPLQLRYYSSVLSISLIDLVFALIFRVPLDRFMLGALVLVTCALLIAGRVIAPVLAYLKDPGRQPLPRRRVAWLAEISTAWMGALLVLQTVVKFRVLPPLLGIDMRQLMTPLELVALPIIHCLFFAAAISSRTFAGVELQTRIGIATGTVVAGNIGADHRLNYTVHGDAVNVAARLEQLNKAIGSRILISASTVELLKNRYPMVEIGRTEVRGKQEPLTIYRLDCSGGEPQAGPVT